MTDTDATENDPTDPVKQQAAALERERAKGVGEVGIYWFFQGMLLGSWVPCTLGEDYGDFVNGPDDHVHFWPRLQNSLRKKLPALGHYEYDQVPRGRVIYRKPDDTFIVLGSERFVRNEGQQREVLKEFCLLDKRVVIKSDEHYGDVPGMLID